MIPIGKPISLAGGVALPLSAGVRVGNIAYLSGQLGLRDGQIVPGGIAEQTNVTLDNIEGLLAELGLGLPDVCKATIWLTRAEDFPGFNAAYGARLSAPFPARSTVVSGLLLPGALIEIEVVAAVSAKQDAR